MPGVEDLSSTAGPNPRESLLRFALRATLRRPTGYAGAGCESVTSLFVANLSLRDVTRPAWGNV